MARLPQKKTLPTSESIFKSFFDHLRTPASTWSLYIEAISYILPYNSGQKAENQSQSVAFSHSKSHCAVHSTHPPFPGAHRSSCDLSFTSYEDWQSRDKIFFESVRNGGVHFFIVIFHFSVGKVVMIALRHWKLR